MVENCNVCIHKVQVVRIRWIFTRAPLVGRVHIVIKQWMLWFAFIIHRIKSNHLYKNGESEISLEIMMLFSTRECNNEKKHYGDKEAFCYKAAMCAIYAG